MSRRACLRLLTPLFLCAVLTQVAPRAQAAPEEDPHHLPVKVVADQRLSVRGGSGSGELALYVSRDWAVAQPGVTEALVIIHGALRNADVYRDSGIKVIEAAHAGASTVLVVPQFLADIDVHHYGLAADTLRWSLTGWEGGSDATAPAPLSSFDALDAIVEKLADRARFPDLKTVVIAGHSGGGQVVQRYALLGKAEALLAGSAVHVRYVIANPSSYAYFDSQRPDGKGEFAPYPGGSCPQFDDWKYGMLDLPRYAGTVPPAELERRYVARDVIYLLGTADTNPNHPALDKSCMGEAEGPYRLARGEAYFEYLSERHVDGTLKHRLILVPGVGHDGDAMLTSACGGDAIFNAPGCTSEQTGGPLIRPTW